MICDECETVAHCMKNGCVPKQNSVDRLLDEAKLLADDRPVEVGHLPEWAIDAEHTIRRLVKALTSVPDWASEAIEQPAPVQQQPVAYQYQSKNGVWRDFISQRHYEATVEDGSWPIRALYTTPPAQEFVCSTGLCHYRKPWVGLTDEERKQLWDDWENGHVVEATEAKLKAKNSP